MVTRDNVRYRVLPPHWRLERLKYLAFVNQKTLGEDTDEDFEIQYIDISNVDPQGRVLGRQSMRFGEAPTRARRVLRRGDTIVSTVRTYLKAIAYIEDSDDNLIGSTGFAVLTPMPHLYPKFLAYYARSTDFIDEVVARSVGVSYPAVNASDVVDIRCPVPPYDEQVQIASFLDRETAKLDQLIEKKRRLIELLQEYRQAVITQAVTKGLDPNVPMKDSGIPWLGEVPAHWEVIKVSRIAASIQTGPFGSQLHATDYIEGGIPVINPSHIVNGEIKPDPTCTVTEHTKQRLRHHELLCGDLVFARRGEIGRCALVTESCSGYLCGTGCLRLRLNTELVCPEFLAYQFQTSAMRQGLLLESVGATMDNLNTSILGRVLVLLPPLKEQNDIVTAIRKICVKVDAAVAKIEAQIKVLTEYRQALISAAVTGQIDVRQWSQGEVEVALP